MIGRRILAALATLLLVLAAFAGTAAAQPPTPAPSTPPSTTAPATPGTAAPATPGTPSTDPSGPGTPAPAAPSSNSDCSDGWKVPIIGTCIPSPGSVVGSAAAGAAKDAGVSMLSSMVGWVLAGFVWIMKYVIQLFMGVSVDVSGTQDAVQKMTGLTSDLQTIALGLGLLIALIAVLYQRAMLSGDNAAPETVGGLVRWAVAATMAAPILIAMSGASDALSSWIFTSAAGPQGPTHVVDALSSALSGRDQKLKTEDVISLALCILGLLAYIELMIQLVLQKFWIIYASVALPIAGATSVIGGGKTVFWALVRVAVAALMFKPIAAICFGVAFMQIRSINSGGDVITAVALMVAPAFILPQLVNMIGTNVSYAGTPMLRGTIRNGRAGIAMGKSAARTGAAGASALGSAAASGAGAASRGAAKAVPFVGAMGRAAMQTLTGPAPSRSSGGAGGGNRAKASTANAAAPAPGSGGRGQSGSTSRTSATSSNTASSSARTPGTGSRRGNTTTNTAAAPSTSSKARTSASASGKNNADPAAAPGQTGTGRARNNTRAGASSTASTDPTPRPGRSAASSSPPRDSAFKRIT